MSDETTAEIVALSCLAGQPRALAHAYDAQDMAVAAVRAELLGHLADTTDATWVEPIDPLPPDDAAACAALSAAYALFYARPNENAGPQRNRGKRRRRQKAAVAA
jgi:hypothetical protein